MKKLVFSIIIFILIFNINVGALNKENNYLEELIPINNNGSLIGVKDIITIPNDYNNDEIEIKPNIFSFINNYKHLIPGEEIKIELEIRNNSNNNYEYINNSFKLDTKDILENENSNNLEEIGIGFDNKKIYNNYSVYRTYNEAIKYLYDQDEYIDDYLSNDSLDYKLKYYGYSGINELDKFYIDYYNDKYNLNESNLNDFTYSVKKDIFSGKISTYKETNSNINVLAYNYFYNKLLYYRFKNDNIDEFNTHNYSIGSYIKDDKNIKDLKNKIIFKNDKLNTNNMYLGLNEHYYSEVFNDYGLYLTMEFKLRKNNSYIKPPDTGI